MIAAFWGTTVGFVNGKNGFVELEMSNGRIMVVSQATFDYLYYKLDDFTAALKQDCIEYVINDGCDSFVGYPDWYIDAYANGLMYRVDDIDYFYDKDYDIAMTPGSFVLRNHKGELMYMESDQFDKYYDTEGAELG